MPATRLNSITYASLKIGEGTSYDLHGPCLLEREYLRLSLVQEVLVRAADEASLLVLTSALEAAWRKPHQDLAYVINGESAVSLSHSGNTGMNAEPRIEEIPRFRSNNSRGYRVRLSLLLPADLTGRDYRAEGSVEVTTDESGIRTAVFRATYTAVPAGNSASAQAASAFPTWVDGYVGSSGSLGGKWGTTDSQVIEHDDQDKLATATTSYREQKYPETSSASSSVPDDARLSLPFYAITTRRRSERQARGSQAHAPVEVTVTFRSNVRVSQTQDLDDLIKDTIRPTLKQLVQNHSKATGSPLEASADLGVDPLNNTIQGSMTFLVPETNLLRASIRTVQREFLGDNYVPVLDGQPFSRDKHVGPGFKVRQVVIYLLERGGGSRTGFLGMDIRGFRTGVAAVDQVIQATTRDGFHVTGAPQVIEEPVELRLGDSGDVLQLHESAAVLDFERADLGGASSAGRPGGGIGSTRTA